jgi:geranylgeranyl diphosphate synthase type I
MEILVLFRDKVEGEIREIMAGGSTPLFGLDLMNHYHLGFSDRQGRPTKGAKGKYLRPTFCLAVCEGLGGRINQALPAAASLELIHRTSLIFDDIQDMGKERNGQPAMWTVWGENQAINAGLALSCFARLAAHRSVHRGLSLETTLRILDVLETAVLEICWGQYFDLSLMETLNVTEEDYLRMVRGKTAALFGAACQIGALVAGADDQLSIIAQHLGIGLGIAFQIHDDYLGIWGDESDVGKTANDLIEKKRSLPVVLALKRPEGDMKRWLQSPAITPDTARAMREWMERHGIGEEVKQVEGRYLRDARTALSVLSLSQEMREHFESLINFLESRKV